MSISSLNTSLSATSSPQQQTQSSTASESINSNVNLNALTSIPTTATTTTSQLVKGKELISNKPSGELFKIKVTNHIDRHIKTSLNESKPIIIGNSLLANVTEQTKLDSNQEDSNVSIAQQAGVLTASKLNTPGLVKSKIMVMFV